MRWNVTYPAFVQQTGVCMRLLFIGTLVLTGAAGCAFEAAPETIDRARVLELVGQLGSDNHDVREAATQKLIDCGEKVLPLIRELRSQPAEVEVSTRLDHRPPCIRAEFDFCAISFAIARKCRRPPPL